MNTALTCVDAETDMAKVLANDRKIVDDTTKKPARPKTDRIVLEAIRILHVWSLDSLRNSLFFALHAVGNW